MVVSLGGLAGLGSLVAALGAWRKSSTAAKELSPNHGSSMKDSVARIEKSQELQLDMMRSLGHQMGEIRASHELEVRERQALDHRAQEEHRLIREEIKTRCI